MEELTIILKSTSAESILLAIVAVVLTAIVKIPIKHYAKKKPLSAKITKYIPLIPFAIGGLLAVFVDYLKNGTVDFNDEISELWISISGVSIAIYSCYENIRDGGRVVFEDKLQNSVYKLLQITLKNKSKSALKELTQRITESYCRSKNQHCYDFFADMQTLLRDDLEEQKIGELSKQIEHLWEELYGSDLMEEVKHVACTATERYEYEVRKKHIVIKSDSESSQNDKGDE